MSELPTLSATKLSTYKTCPRKYFYDYIEHHEQDSSIYALNGTAIHKTIETYYNNTAQAPPIAMYQRFLSEQMQKNSNIVFLDRFASVFATGASILRTFPWETYTPIATELSFSLPFPNKENPICILRGYIDMVEENSVLDFKTSATKPSKKALAVNPQFQVYAWVFEQLYGKKPENVYWVHLRDHTRIKADVETAPLVTLVKQLVHDTTFVPTQCQYCPFPQRCTNGSINS